MKLYDFNKFFLTLYNQFLVVPAFCSCLYDLFYRVKETYSLYNSLSDEETCVKKLDYFFLYQM